MHEFIGFEYLEHIAPREPRSLYLDGYRSFGWAVDDNLRPSHDGRFVTLRLKRDRKIRNQVELTRLQRHFEASMEALAALERAKTTGPTMAAIGVGLLGTGFMAGSVFAVTHAPPLIFLCALLAIPGFLGWVAPCFLYRRLLARKAAQLAPFIESAYDQLYEICKKASRLLPSTEIG